MKRVLLTADWTLIVATVVAVLVLAALAAFGFVEWGTNPCPSSPAWEQEACFEEQRAERWDRWGGVR